jgi:hypothetical protein
MLCPIRGQCANCGNCLDPNGEIAAYMQRLRSIVLEEDPWFRSDARWHYLEMYIEYFHSRVLRWGSWRSVSAGSDELLELFFDYVTDAWHIPAPAKILKLIADYKMAKAIGNKVVAKKINKCIDEVVYYTRFHIPPNIQTEAPPGPNYYV